MIPVNENYRYMINDEVAIEDFTDSSLIFLSKKNRLIRINSSTRQILNLLDGKRNLQLVIMQFSHNQKIQEKIAREDIQKIIIELIEKKVIRPAIKMSFNGRDKMDENSSFLANPRISLREEDGGALLFNIDTNSLQIINPIGLVIWRFINIHPRSKADIVRYLCEICENVPLKQVESDVELFIFELLNKGFVGDVHDEKQSCRNKSN